jgi:hypothetical protein
VPRWCAPVASHFEREAVGPPKPRLRLKPQYRRALSAAAQVRRRPIRHKPRGRPVKYRCPTASFARRDRPAGERPGAICRYGGRHAGDEPIAPLLLAHVRLDAVALDQAVPDGVDCKTPVARPLRGRGRFLVPSDREVGSTRREEAARRGQRCVSKTVRISHRLSP